MSRSKINVEILGGFLPSEACPLNSCGNVGAAHGRCRSCETSGIDYQCTD
jgi:predicted RNA-binding Zn-ribbon protein involved in translation (DUF1610 family)